MKIIRILLLVAGWLLIIVNTYLLITIDFFTTNDESRYIISSKVSGVGYFIGFQVGRLIPILIGIIFVVVAGRLKPKLSN